MQSLFHQVRMSFEEKKYIEELDEEFEKSQQALREEALNQLAAYKQGKKGLPF